MDDRLLPQPEPVVDETSVTVPDKQTGQDVVAVHHHHTVLQSVHKMVKRESTDIVDEGGSSQRQYLALQNAGKKCFEALFCNIFPSGNFKNGTWGKKVIFLVATFFW